MLTVCMVCRGVIVAAPAGPRGEVSHGICEKCLRNQKEQLGLTDEDIDKILSENPLDPSAWLAEKHRFDMPGEAAGERLGVHTTDSFDVAVAYAVHKASQEGDLEDGEPNCGVVLELDMSNLKPMAEADAKVAAEFESVIIEELGELFSDIDLYDRENVEEVAQRVLKYTESMEQESEPAPESWWDFYWTDAVGMPDLNKMWTLLRDLALGDRERLLDVLCDAFERGGFQPELWAESIGQFRYMVPVSEARLLAIHLVRPVQDELVDDGEDDDGEGPQLMGFEDLYPQTIKIWDESRERQFKLWPKSRGRVEFHGTDLSRARLAFPELESVLVSLWPYGQPEGVGPA